MLNRVSALEENPVGVTDITSKPPIKYIISN